MHSTNRTNISPCTRQNFRGARRLCMFFLFVCAACCLHDSIEFCFCFRAQAHPERRATACNLHFTGDWTVVAAAAAAATVVAIAARGGRKPFRVYSHTLAPSIAFVYERGATTRGGKRVSGTESERTKSGARQ